MYKKKQQKTKKRTYKHHQVHFRNGDFSKNHYQYNFLCGSDFFHEKFFDYIYVCVFDFFFISYIQQ